MSIPINSLCVQCLLNKQIQNAQGLGDDETLFSFIKACMQIILDGEPEDNSSVIGARINKLYAEFFGISQDRFQAEKEASNRFIMERLEKIRKRVQI